MLARFRIGNLARCQLLPVLLIQEKPIAKFAIMVIVMVMVYCFI